MMGRQAKSQQVKTFYQAFLLDRRVRADHPLRKINQLIDFDFTYKEVADSYGVNGTEMGSGISHYFLSIFSLPILSRISYT